MSVSRAGQPLLLAERVQAIDCDTRPLTLTLRPGDRVGLLGTKSDELHTLLCTLARLQRPTEGRLFWGVTDVTRRPRWLLPRRLRAQVRLLWANPYALFEDDVRVRTAIGRRVRGMSASAGPDARLRANDLSPALSGFKVGSLSGLTRVRVALTYTQRRQPGVILVDDVFAHLVPEGWPVLLAAVEEIAGETGAVIIASRFPEALRTMAQIVDLRDGSNH